MKIIKIIKIISIILKQVWLTNRRIDGRTSRYTFLPVEVQFYVSVMFLGLPDDIHKEPVWSTNRCVLSTYFFNLIHGQTDRPTVLLSCRDAISVMFLGLPDDIHEEKPSFLQSKTRPSRPTMRPWAYKAHEAHV